MADLQPTDVLLVNRAGVDYSVPQSDVMADVLDTDLLLVNRNGVDYQATYADVKRGFGGQKINPAPGDWTFSPAIAGGNGTQSDPYIVTPEIASVPGGTLQSAQTLTLTGLTPELLVDWTDNSVGAGTRFAQPLSLVPQSGQVDIRLIYVDTPESTAETVYTGDLQIGTTYFRWVVTQTTNKAPIIGSVALADSPEAGRFTSATFATTVTMTEDGIPPSTKAMKAWVEGTLKSAAQTSAITQVDEVVQRDYETQTSKTNGGSWQEFCGPGNADGNFPLGSQSAPGTITVNFNPPIQVVNELKLGAPGFWGLQVNMPPQEFHIPGVLEINNSSAGVSGNAILPGPFNLSKVYFKEAVVRDGVGSSRMQSVLNLIVDGVTLISGATTTNLTFGDNTDLEKFVQGDIVVEIGGGDNGTGTVANSNPSVNTLTLIDGNGYWDVGSQVRGPSKTVYITPTSGEIVAIGSHSGGTLETFGGQYGNNTIGAGEGAYQPHNVRWRWAVQFTTTNWAIQYSLNNGVSFTNLLSGTESNPAISVVCCGGTYVFTHAGVTDYAVGSITASRTNLGIHGYRLSSNESTGFMVIGANGGANTGKFTTDGSTFNSYNTGGPVPTAMEWDGGFNYVLITATEVHASTSGTGGWSLTFTPSTAPKRLIYSTTISRFVLLTADGTVYTSLTGATWGANLGVVSPGTNFNLDQNSFGIIARCDQKYSISTDGTTWNTYDIPIPVQKYAVIDSLIHVVQNGNANAGAVTYDGISWLPAADTGIGDAYGANGAVTLSEKFSDNKYPLSNQSWNMYNSGRINDLEGTYNYLTFNSDKDLADFDAGVAATQDDGQATGTVLLTSPVDKQMYLTLVTGTFGPINTGRYVTAPQKAASGVKLYTVHDASGAVSDLQSADPGYVEMAGSSPYTLTFPATFPTGNEPDVDLPAGTTITAEVQATSTGATPSVKTSNTVTPI